MNHRLNRAVQEGDMDAFYALIRENPHLLERIHEIPFVDTPLHVAASAGHTHFALEIMRLKPSFARKPNPDGFSPVHLALQNGQTQMVLLLVEDDPDLVRVKGRGGVTPLHYVAKTGNIDLLAEFLSACPKSVEDLTIRRENALHIAVKNHMFEAFEVLMGWLQQGFYEGGPNFKKNVLNRKDVEGNTVLHIATSTNQSKVVSLLVNNGVTVNAKNSEGLTALDIVIRQRQLDNGEITDVLCRARAVRASRLPSVTTRAENLRSKKSFYECWAISIFRGRLYMSGDNRNALLVVAVLIATTTYQAGLTPPGGVWLQDDYEPPNLNTTTTATTMNLFSSPPHCARNKVLEPFDFHYFTILNMTTFYMSIAIIFILLPPDSFAPMLAVLLCMLFLCHKSLLFVISGRGIEIFLSDFLIFSILVFLLLWYMTFRKLKLLLYHQTPLL